jgi:hypothetical protein
VWRANSAATPTRIESFLPSWHLGIGVGLTSLCFYCRGTYPIPGERFCSKCRDHLTSDKISYLKRLIAEAQEDMANFEVLSKGAAKYRISEGKAVSDEYATKRFGELVQTIRDRIKALSDELAN